MSMVTITCPHCGFSKDVNQGSTPPEGTKVTCPKCRASFPYMQAQADAAFASLQDSPPCHPIQNFALPLPPKLSPPQTHREPFRNQSKTRKTNGLKPIGVTVGVLVIVLVLAYGINFGYTKLTAKLNADNWGTLSAIASSEQNERDTILTQTESLLMASNYDELERIADDYRNSKATFANGEWKLSVFYDDLSYYLYQTPEENWVNRLNKLKEWVAAKPDSITARVALAECLDGYAFHGRGAAYANEVQEDQWRRFKERLDEAQGVLDQAKSMQQKCPGWWAAYLRLAVGLEWDRDQYNEFLASAIAYEPTYNVYYYRAAWYLLPWWFGEEGDWENFAKSAADHVGGNDGDILYTRIVWFLDCRTPRNVVTQNPRIQWKRVDNGIKLIREIGNTPHI